MSSASLQSEPSTDTQTGLKTSRLPKIFWLVSVVALLLILLSLPRSPLPWLDEIFYVSGALSAARGAPPVPSVMASFPHTVRMDLLYGPLMFWLGSLSIKLFGLSVASWRLWGFLGAVGAVLGASFVTRRLDDSKTAAAAAAMIVALSQGMGARATSGRFDTFTVALEILSLACSLRAMEIQESRRRAVAYAVLAGICCGFAALSTPRAFPFVLALFTGIFVEFALRRNRSLLTQLLVMGASGLLPVLAWTLSQGMSPIGWLRFISTASRGDTVNASPILHGSSWQLFSGPRIPLVSGVLFILMMLLLFGGTATSARGTIETEGDDAVSRIRVASITVLVNYVFLLLMIARFWDYEIFVVPLVTPVLIALSAKVLRNGSSRPLRRALLSGWLIIGMFLVTVRSGKLAGWLASYGERDPRPLENFIAGNLPRNSCVFGPEDFYFYAVERAGSHYLFWRKYIPPGLVSKLDHDLDWREQIDERQPVYLIWRTGAPLPPGLRPADLRLVGSFNPELPKESSVFGNAGWASGYPRTELYQVIGAGTSSSH